MQVNYGNFANPIFSRAVSKLAQTPMNAPAGFRVMQFMKAVRQAHEKVRDQLHKELLPQYAILDNGKPVQDDKSPVGFKLKDGVNADAYEKAENEFNQKQITVSGKKLTQKTLEDSGIQFSPAELEQLEPFVEFPIETA